jgi:hypothetical protein
LTRYDSSTPKIDAKYPSFFENEWKTILMARKTHIHTRQAIKKLSKLLVGELEVGQTIKFSPDEYRRYALISRTDSTDGQFTKLKFALLYPFDKREEEPNHFEPGEVVEIQATFRGKTQTRYYTPVEGNTIAFTIYVKFKSEGFMSDYIKVQHPGKSQIKIRGPFGVPLLQKEVQTPDSNFPRQIFFFAGGSGITPCLHLLTHFYLPIGIPLTVYSINQR